MTEIPLGMRQMDWEHTATVNRPATSQQVPVGSGPESAQCMPGRRIENDDGPL